MVRLQSFDHRESPYERPDRKWVCGHAADGDPCRIGPDRSGRCQARHECAPRLGGSRWECTRPAASGGRCPDGPFPDGTCCRPIVPCVPVRSARGRRGFVVTTALAVIVALFAVLLTGAAGTWFIDPGPLTLAHAQLGACDGCHKDLGAGPVAWLHAAVAWGPHDRAQPCLGCHVLGKQPMDPHGVDPAALTLITGRLLDRAGAGGSKNAKPMGGNDSAGQVACGTCHQEHRGAHADLRLVSDAQCQTCHAVQFASLSKGHPGFDNYPYRKRTALVFDHTAHYDRHFSLADAADRPGACTTCHTLGPVGRSMPVRAFDVSCGGCHADQIRGHGTIGSKGIAVFTVPGLDSSVLDQRGASVGDWPTFADGPLTPLMRLLLSADPALAEDVEQAAGLDLYDLATATEAQIATAKRLAWGVKALLQELMRSGQAGLVARIEKTLGQELDVDTASALAAGLPADLVASARTAWFPRLDEELAAHRTGRPLPGTARMNSEPTSAASAPSTGASGETDIIPGGGILDAAPQAQDESAEAASDLGDIIPGGGILGTTPQAQDGSAETASDLGDIIPGGGILGAVPQAQDGSVEAASDLGDIVPGGGIPGTTPQAQDGSAEPASDLGDIIPGGGILGAAPQAQDGSAGATIGQGDIIPGGGILGAAPPGPMTIEPSAEPSEETAVLQADEWSKLGGWYRTDFSLRYKPMGHADRFAYAWLQVLGDGTAPNAKAAFDALAKPAGPGSCAKCHSIDAVSPGTSRVNWTGRRPDVEFHPTTKFDHAPHLNLLAEGGCRTCHQTVGGSAYLESYEGRDPGQFTAGFRSIGLETCSSCHVPGRAGDACVACHSYHVGPIPRARAMSAAR